MSAPLPAPGQIPAAPPWVPAMQANFNHFDQQSANLNLKSANLNLKSANLNLQSANINLQSANLNLQSANFNLQLVNTYSQLTNLSNTIAAMRNEMHLLLMNRYDEDHEPLFNPTIPGPGRVFLAPPHPTTRDELLVFTEEQCVASAAALGLPPLPQNTPIAMHRKQIALKLLLIRLC